MNGQHQLDRLNYTLRWAKERSRFYSKHLPDIKRLNLKSLDETQRLPFTEERHLSGGIEEFLCVPPNEISRIVSLFTSGCTGPPKRVCFTGDDLENIIGYFSDGMSRIAEPGQRVLICLPGKSENGVSHLLSLGIKKFGGLPTIYGSISDPDDAAAFAADLKPQCIVGIPVQILALAECYSRKYHGDELKTALLTADYAAESLKKRIRQIFGCRVLNHYGSTEMGYGGALECGLQNGLHLRDMDLYFEIIDPKSGKPLPPGAAGELVFTTLSRRGMPLIRYRTGDFTSFLKGECGCGQVLNRIEAPLRLNGGMMRLRGQLITMSELDEILFSNRQVMDYSVSVTNSVENEALLKLLIWSIGEDAHLDSALLRTLSSALPQGVDISISIAKSDDISPGLRGKRTITKATMNSCASGNSMPKDGFPQLESR